MANFSVVLISEYCRQTDFLHLDVVLYYYKEKYMSSNFTFRRFLWVVIVLLIVSLLYFSSCTSSSSTKSDFYNAGNANLSVTGSQLDQYTLFRFDTSNSAHTLALPSAEDIIANLSSPYAGQVIFFAVAADGTNAINLIAGTNVTIKPSASAVTGNTTLTMYIELDNITSGREAVTIY